MALYDIAEVLIGSELVDVVSVTLHSDSNTALLTAIGFRFLSRSLIVHAFPDDDTICIEVVRDIAAWIAARNDSVALRTLRNDLLAHFVGQHLCNFWECHAKNDYVDAVDLGFGDLNYPTIKILCSCSELNVFALRRLEPAR